MNIGYGILLLTALDAAAASAPASAPPSAAPPAASRSPSGSRTVDARLVGDADAPSPPKATPPTVSAPPPSPGGHDAAEHIRVALRVGALVPRTELGSGFAVGAEAGYLLPVLEQRLRLQLGFGYSMSPYQGARIVPGRGYDAHFTQNTTIMPLDLSAVFEQPLGDSGLAIYGGLGIGVLFVSTRFQSFDTTTEAGDITFGPVVQLGIEYPLGPGQLVVDSRYTEATADLGTLGIAGQNVLGNVVFTAGYAIRL